MQELKTIFILFEIMLQQSCEAEAKKRENQFISIEWVMKHCRFSIGMIQDTAWNMHIGGWDYFYDLVKNCRQNEIEEIIRDMESQIKEWSQPYHDIYFKLF